MKENSNLELSIGHRTYWSFSCKMRYSIIKRWANTLPTLISTHGPHRTCNLTTVHTFECMCMKGVYFSRGAHEIHKALNTSSKRRGPPMQKLRTMGVFVGLQPPHPPIPFFFKVHTGSRGAWPIERGLDLGLCPSGFRGE